MGKKPVKKLVTAKKLVKAKRAETTPFEEFTKKLGKPKITLPAFVKSLQKALADSENSDAVAYVLWVDFPLLCERIEFFPDADSDEKFHAQQSLNALHHQATERLAELAESMGLSSGPLFEADRVCLQLCDPQNKFNLVCGMHQTRLWDTWPWSLGQARDQLPLAMQEAIRAGGELLNRIGTKYSLKEKSGSQAEQQETASSAIEWTLPDTVTQWARLFGGIDRKTMAKRLNEYAQRNAAQKVGREWKIDMSEIPEASRSKLRKPSK